MAQKVPYELLGGEDGVRRLCRAFYRDMDQSSDAKNIRRMHKQDLSEIENKFFNYMSAWLGGPPLYSDKTGGMCLTQPHRPYAIGSAERDQWLSCMDRALEEVSASDDVKNMIKQPLFQVADMIRNQD